MSLPWWDVPFFRKPQHLSAQRKSLLILGNFELKNVEF